MAQKMRVLYVVETYTYRHGTIVHMICSVNEKRNGHAKGEHSVWEIDSGKCHLPKKCKICAIK